MLEDYEEEFLKLIKNDMSRKTFMDALWDYKERPEELETFCRELAVFSEGYAVGRKTQFDKMFTSTYELTKAKEESESLKKELAEAKDLIKGLVKDMESAEEIFIFTFQRLKQAEDFIKGAENDIS